MLKAWTSSITNQYFLFKRLSKNVQKCIFLKTPEFGMHQKAHILFSGLPNMNLFHILTQDTGRNHLKQITKN